MEREPTYKELHEAFVSNLTGTTVTDVGLILFTPVISIVLRNIVAAFIFYPTTTKTSFALDFITYILPTQLCMTALADHYIFFHISLFIAGGCIIIFLHRTETRPQKTIANSRRRTRKSRQGGSSTPSPSQSQTSVITEYMNKIKMPLEGQRTFVTNFRAFTYVSTVIAIQAVDFVIFPRRLAKAETYGSGLMDIGVGAYVVANAIVCPEARGKANIARTIPETFRRISKSLISSAPLFVLGFARFITVKQAEVAEHVSEYGVHWNFFFTLAAVKVLSTVILCFIDPKLSCAIATFVAIIHQFILSWCGGMNFIIFGSDGFGSRNNLVDANREGMMSTLGYVAIFFAGVHLGQLYFSKKSPLEMFLQSGGIGAVFYGLLAFYQHYCDPISRRAANLPYIMWIVAFCSTDVAFLIAADMITDAFHLFIKKKPEGHHYNLLEAINENGLAFFLLANGLTGCVNLCMKTIFAPPAVGLVVNTVYLLILCMAMSFLKAKKIRTKIW